MIFSLGACSHWRRCCVLGDAFKVSLTFAKEDQGGTPSVVLKMSKEDEMERKDNIDW